MFDYVISYDICALMLMLLFFFYYYSRKRFDTSESRLFTILSYLCLSSIALDLISYTTLLYRNSLPAFVNYLTNILYFFITGLMSFYFCVYSLIDTKSIQSYKKSKTVYLVILIPFSFFSLLLFSTPWNGLVFRMDENKDYVQGPMINILLLVVLGYLVFSMIRITFFHGNISIKKRNPFYTFSVLMIVSIIIQAFTKKYLMYGIAEAIGIIMLYLTNHNPGELLDDRTNLFNRRALILKLNEKRSMQESCSVIGIGIKNFIGINNMNYVKDDENNPTEYMDYLLGTFADFLKGVFDERSLYYTEYGVFALIIKKAEERETVENIIRQRFQSGWKIKNKEIMLEYGIGIVDFPNDTHNPLKLIDILNVCVNISTNSEGKLISSDYVKDERDLRIEDLENRQKMLEEQYEESENKMQMAVNADKSKSLFLAQMSHEIRTPMTAILGMTELILRDTRDERVLEHASAIMASGKTLINLINDILDFSKIEAGKLDIIPENYNITSTVMDVINAVEQRVSEKRLDFGVHLAPDIPLVLYGDEMRIRQIVLNLLTNAVKYTVSGSVFMDITATSTDSDKIMLNISVKDTGIGISKENLPKLFDGFERFDLSKNKGIEGTGLGLGICRQLTQAMGGRIGVESEPGVGSTFSVVLPQTIIDNAHAVNIEKTDELYFLVYYGNSYERFEFETTLADFNIKADYCSNSDEMNAALATGEAYTHIFITYGEFERRKAANDPLISDSRLIIELYYRQYMIRLLGYKVMHMPINAITLNAVLKGESVYENKNRITGPKQYIAPNVSLLVVDDNLVNLKIFTELLECHKMRIDTADSGDKAVYMASNRQYDMIFIDHMMPKKDGIETLNEILEQDNDLNKDTPIIAFTANAVSGMKEMFIEKGFKDFLSKPIDISKLEEMLVQYIPEEKLIFESVKENEDTAENNNIDRTSESELVIEGLDTENAAKLMGGSKKNLLNILEVLSQDGHDKLETVKAFARDKEYDRFRIEIHAIKSLLKSIGKNELSDRARQLEMACKDGDYGFVDANWSAVIDEYEVLLNNVEAGLKEYNDRLSSVKAKEDKPAENSLKYSFQEYLLFVRALLHEYEEELTIKLLDQLDASDLTDEEHGTISQIRNKMTLFDYDGALKIITEVIG